MFDWAHTSVFLSGFFTLGVIAHMVNTFPTPENKYAAWLLGSIQYAVGQRVVGSNTIQGLQTIAQGVTTEEKKQFLSDQKPQ